MTITKGNVIYKDSNDSLTDRRGYVTCSCGGAMKLVKIGESAKKYINTYKCECGNTITAEIRRSRK